MLAPPNKGLNIWRDKENFEGTRIEEQGYLAKLEVRACLTRKRLHLSPNWAALQRCIIKCNKEGYFELDVSIHVVHFEFHILSIRLDLRWLSPIFLYKIWNFKIQNYFIIQLLIRYWQFIDEIYCDGLNCNPLSVVNFGDFLVV